MLPYPCLLLIPALLLSLTAAADVPVLDAQRLDVDSPEVLHSDVLNPEMLTIPGVARKTANVVLGNAYGIYEGIAVDTHVRRLALKFDLTDHKDPVKIEQDLMKLIPKKDWKWVNHQMVLYGRYMCPAHKHNCADHPLTKIYPKAAKIWPLSH